MNVFRHLLLTLMALAMVSTSGAMALARTAPDGQVIVICTGMGLSTVTLDANGEAMDPNPICPECLVHNLAVLNGSLNIGDPSNTLSTLQPTIQARDTLSFEAVQATARGPPLAV